MARQPRVNDPAQRGPSVEAKLRAEIKDLETRLGTANSTQSAALQAELQEIREELSSMKDQLIPIQPNDPAPANPPPNNPPPPGDGPGDPAPPARKPHILF
jgi:hypothetical protein